MKVAIIGSGIAGNTTAYLLCDKHEITLFEKEDRIGGHSHTHEVSIENKIVSVDTGFIVFNKKTYPLFTRLLDDLNVDYINSHMSFSVHSKKNNFEYNGTNLNGLFAQRKNLLNPRFLMMIYEIFKFNKHAKKILNQTENITMHELLNQLGLSSYFQQNYIFPMGSAIWSSDINAIMNFPAHFFIQFFDNHGMLSINERPQWLTIKGGSKNYVAKLTEKFKDKIRINSQIKAVHRKKDKVEVQSNHGNETYDYVFFACHSDEALKLMANPTQIEKNILGAIPFTQNEITLHTDENVLPKSKRAWAAWNYNIDNDVDEPIYLTYNMNILQSLPLKTPLLVSLNLGHLINQTKILKKFNYSHPYFSIQSQKAQAQKKLINGKNRSLYVGAYWHNGFHEDGVKSAYEAVDLFNSLVS